MDLDRVMMERRSHRIFSSDPVSDEDVLSLVEAVRVAPSWANTQCVRVIAVRDEDRRRALSETLSEKNPARKAVAQAPVTVALAARLGLSGFKKGEAVDDKAWHMFDTGLAMQNLCLKAHAMGLGTVIVGYFDYRKAGDILRVPEDHQVVALTPVGIPEGTPSTPQRLEVSELLHHETWEG